MKNKVLQAELWEIQIILYWILGAILFATGHSILGWIATGYGIICVPPTMHKLWKHKQGLKGKNA